MGAALRLEDFMPDPEATVSLAANALAETDAGNAQRVSDLEKLLEENSRSVARIRAGAARLVAAARNEQPENIEELIDQLLQLERRMEGQWGEGIRNGERLLRLLEKAPRSHRSSMEPLVGKILDTLQEVKETTRDARWQLIVVRAEMLPKGEGPVFDNARELGQALDKLKV
jgi:hypothetical protein